MQLRWNARSKVNPSYEVMNFGESKGLTVDRAFIYPTKDMVDWIRNPDRPELLKNPTRARLYVALTRARHSVAIALDPEEGEVFEGATIYQ
ncbi:TPA: hypothetical protein ACVOYM_001423 [Vibrio diabolicus]